MHASDCHTGLFFRHRRRVTLRSNPRDVTAVYSPERLMTPAVSPAYQQAQGHHISSQDSCYHKTKELNNQYGNTQHIA